MKKTICFFLVIFLITPILSFSQHKLDKRFLPVTTKSESAIALYSKAWDEVHYKGPIGVLKAYNDAIKEDPDFFMAYTWQAIFYANSGNVKQFEKYANLALKCNIKHNKSEKIFKHILETKLADSQFDIIPSFEQLLDLYPKVEEVYIYLSFIHFLNNNFEKAVKIINKAIEMGMNNPQLYNCLGYCYAGLKQNEEAEKAHDKYIKILPDAPNAYDSKGDFYVSAGNYEKAYKCFMKANELGWGYQKAKNAMMKMLGVELKKYSDEERWGRSSRFNVVSICSAIGYVKSIGETPIDYAAYLVEKMVPAWSRSYKGSVKVVQGIYRNQQMFPESEFEIMKISEESVTARTTYEWIKLFGENGVLYDTTIDEYKEVFKYFNEELAKSLGMTYEESFDEKWQYMTFTKK